MRFFILNNHTMNIKNYLDSTYLKTAAQANISKEENDKIVRDTIREAIDEQFKLVMIRPEYVAMAKQLIASSQSHVSVGTVISFPEGTCTLEEKLQEATQAINDGADDLDFVCNYKAFKNGEMELVKQEVLACTALGLQHHKTVKWIIEVAALSDAQIIQFSALIKNCIMAHFDEASYKKVFVKSSTGFFKTEHSLPNGATVAAIQLMIENASPLPVKAAGGVRNFEEAQQMIRLGVKRIGTSAAKAISLGAVSDSEY